jgi:glycosyltransferase involved in cell wall biosynthesis
VALLTRERGREDIFFAIIGGGPAVPELRRLMARLGIEDHCLFTGYLPDEEVGRWLATADLGIDPDPRKAWSDRSTMNKVMDYMFFGCPVVGFDLTENRRSAGEAGLFVEANSEAALADGIEMLLGDAARRRRMADCGRDRVRRELLWRHSEPNLLAAYAQLLPTIVSGDQP